MASLMHQWDNNLHDYVLLITFPTEMSTKLKSLLLAAAFLLVYFFSELGKFHRKSKRKRSLEVN